MSLKQVAGGPSPSAIKETRTNAKAASGVSGKYAVVDGSDQASNEFPIVPFAPDAYDDVADIKNKFAQAPAGQNWVVPFTEQDASYVRRQRDQMENADFDRWVMGKFDLEDPAQLFLFQQIAPEQFQRRMDLIDYEQNLVTKYAKMRLMGPRSLDDLKFEWLIETGRVELPQGPIWDPVTWMTKQAGGPGAANPNTRNGWAARGQLMRQRYMAGIFSPLRMLTQDQVGWQPTDNRGDIRGNPTEPVFGQLYEGSNRPNSYINYGGTPIISQYAYPYDANRFGAAFGGAANPAGAALVVPRPGYARNPYAPVDPLPAVAPVAPGDPGFGGYAANARARGELPRR